MPRSLLHGLLLLFPLQIQTGLDARFLDSARGTNPHAAPLNADVFDVQIEYKEEG
jgi:hypothetical protein